MQTEKNVVERNCFELLQKAIHLNASDIHLIPTKDSYNVSFKIHSRLTHFTNITPQLVIRMISFYKYLSSLDISVKRTPQSGSFHKQIFNENYSFRVSTIPSIHLKESVVIRIQKHNRIINLDKLCFEKEWSEKLRIAVANEQGLVLLTGPTGSGKTTTIYSLTAYCVNELNRQVISLEDPVENNLRHLLQVQVNEQSGISYSSGLKAILRHSPDVIMIGEIRDRETAQIAIQASLTGHLVLTTVHSKDPIGSLYRMMDFGITLEELRQTVVCISTQRIISNPNGNTKAVFEIIEENQVELIIDSIARGEKITRSKDIAIGTLVQKYRLQDASRIE